MQKKLKIEEIKKYHLVISLGALIKRKKLKRSDISLFIIGLRRQAYDFRDRNEIPLKVLAAKPRKMAR